MSSAVVSHTKPSVASSFASSRSSSVGMLISSTTVGVAEEARSTAVSLAEWALVSRSAALASAAALSAFFRLRAFLALRAIALRNCLTNMVRWRYSCTKRPHDTQLNDEWIGSWPTSCPEESRTT